MAEATKRLYLVKCRGMAHRLGSDYAPGIAYVIATDAADAYKRLLDTLNKLDLGFSKDREMHTVELLAEDSQYPGCGITLYP